MASRCTTVGATIATFFAATSTISGSVGIAEERRMGAKETEGERGYGEKDDTEDDGFDDVVSTMMGGRVAESWSWRTTMTAVSSVAWWRWRSTVWRRWHVVVW